MMYIVLLRGVNVGGVNTLCMNEFSLGLNAMGYLKVKTVLNSGNIIIWSDLKDRNSIKEDVNKLLLTKFNISVPIVVVSYSELEDVVKNSPSWWGTSDKNVYDNLIFVIPPCKCSDVFKTVGSASPLIDFVSEYKNYIFWSFDLKNYRKSNWWVKTISSSIKDSITIRTSNTVNKILNVCRRDYE